MHLFFRKVLYGFNIIALIISIVCFIYFTIKLFINIDDWTHWLIKTFNAFVPISILFFLLLIRKQHFPLPGIDYK